MEGRRKDDWRERERKTGGMEEQWRENQERNEEKFGMRKMVGGTE